MSEKLSDIKLVLTDIDGVWTDGGMYYDNHGNEFKKFNTRDGMGVERLRNCGIETVICTSENTEIVKARAKKLQIDKCFLGVKDKGKFFYSFCKENNLKPKSVAYIGDDVNDLDIINNAGFSACPADAFEEVKEKVNYVCKTMSGKGAFREFAELILEDKNKKTN